MRLQIQFKVEKVPSLPYAFMSFQRSTATSIGRATFVRLFHFDRQRSNKCQTFCFAVRFIHDREFSGR